MHIIIGLILLYIGYIVFMSVFIAVVDSIGKALDKFPAMGSNKSLTTEELCAKRAKIERGK